MKIIFYDIREFEFEYILEKITNDLEPYFLKTSLNENTYVDEKYSDTEAISAFVSSSLNKKALEKFPKLKYIFLRSAGYSNVDIEFCKEKNIQVFNVPNYASSTVGEYTFALILNLYKKISKAKSQIEEGEIDVFSLMGSDLNKKTIGVIGAGSIGRKVINIAQGFNMKVLVFDKIEKGAYNFVSLDELLEKSDIVSINCPLTKETKNLFNRNTFLKMKRNAILINTARGEIVDTEALYMAISERKIQGAALDVVECEEVLCQNYKKCQEFKNIKELCYRKYFFIQKLLKLDNVIITPHNAYNTKEANKKIVDTTFENIKQVTNNIEKTGYINLVLL